MHVETDLVKSEFISQRLGCAVWMKMETQQISGSFKYRGISLLCKKVKSNYLYFYGFYDAVIVILNSGEQEDEKYWGNL